MAPGQTIRITSLPYSKHYPVRDVDVTSGRTETVTLSATLSVR